MIGKMKELLQIGNLPEREPVLDREGERPPLGERTVDLHELDKDGKRVFSDKDFCALFGLEAHFKEVRKTIEERLSKAPKETAVRCPKCGWRGVVRGRLKDRTGCLYCNAQNLKDGAQLKAMSKGEIEEWKKDKAAAMKATAPERARQATARALANQAELDKLGR